MQEPKQAARQRAPDVASTSMARVSETPEQAARRHARDAASV